MTSIPDPSRSELIETSGLLAELVSTGQVCATRSGDGELVFFTVENAPPDDVVPVSDVLRELMSDFN